MIDRKGPWGPSSRRGVELFHAHLGLCRRWSGAESAGPRRGGAEQGLWWSKTSSHMHKIGFWWDFDGIVLGFWWYVFGILNGLIRISLHFEEHFKGFCWDLNLATLGVSQPRGWDFSALAPCALVEEILKRPDIEKHLPMAQRWRLGWSGVLWVRHEWRILI